MITKELIGQRIKLEEGFSENKYICPAGYLTIGFGRNLQAYPNTNKELNRNDNLDSGITRSEATILLYNDIERAMSQIDKHIPYAKNLNEDRYCVLIDLIFNLGLNGLLGFKKFLSALGTGNYDKASEELLDSRYAKQVPNRAKRNAECIKTGLYRR